MKEHILPALKLTVFCFLLLVVMYAAIVWVIAQAAPNNGQGETISANGGVVGFAKEGQLFNQDKYFWSRPSAVNYNGASSGGSNKGPSNPEYLKEVRARIDIFLAKNPGVTQEQIPSELVTASGSGLDPHISPQAAYMQSKRVAAIRGVSEVEIKTLIEQHIERPLAGVFGTKKINVLKLNIALDELKK